jgi:hypothetical protein
MFFVPAPGINGQNGWFVLGRRGRAALEQPQQFAAYAKAAAFPRELLHPAIAERVWAAALARGEYDVAVFYATRALYAPTVHRPSDLDSAPLLAGQTLSTEPN